MKNDNVSKRSIIPAVVMVCFTGILLIALVVRVLRADRDLGMIRVAKRQARLAAESGAQYALQEIRKIISATTYISSNNVLTASYFEDKMPIDEWISFGLKTDAKFKIIGIRKITAVDNRSTALVDESQRFQVITHGQSHGNTYSVSAIIQMYDIVSLFSVFNSLNEFYYGIPLLQWIEGARSVEAFIEANQEVFSLGFITERGVCHDAKLLHDIYAIDGKSPFKDTEVGTKVYENYSAGFLMNSDSPCKGPLYCDTPIVLDTHKFFGPVQTALYLFRRKGAKPRVSMGHSIYTINSSMRVQKAAGILEGKNPTELILDRDTPLTCSHIPDWNPDFNVLKNLAKKSGIYIDADGKGSYKGKIIDVDYHAGESHLFSDSYILTNSIEFKQDELNEKHIILSSDSKFNGNNNIDAASLRGASIVYSERAVYIRGDIGHDVVIVSPKHIYITGPTNVDSALNLFLIAKQGVALSTVDLEEYIAEQKPSNEFIDAAREWIIRAVIYKPGSGVYTSSSRPQKSAEGSIKPVTFRRVFSGKSLKIKILGACIGGNLTRWINNVERDGLSVNWDPGGVSRLLVRPIVANVIRTQTKSE